MAENGYFRNGSRLAARLRERGSRVIMVVGGPDTGKTTFIEELSGLLSERAAVAVLDLDMGQSHIGPPTTIAWGRVEGGFKGWNNIRAEDIYFTGTLSPPGNLLPALVGAKKVLDLAVSRCEKLVIDTTGLIAGPLGRVFKHYKIELLNPDVIIGLERASELDHILGPLKSGKRTIIRLKTRKAVSYKTPAARAGYRQEAFRRYFLDSRQVEIRLDRVGVRHTRADEGGTTVGRIISLRDGDKDLALGFVVRRSMQGNSLVIRAPLESKVRFTTVLIGEAVVPEGILNA